MKTIGLIGGMSWESTAEYYRTLNQLVKQELGEQHSCKCILYSVDFGEIEVLQHNGKWNELSSIMIDIAKKLEKAGADIILICSNTMHMMANEVQSSVKIPLLHIGDATGEQIQNKKLKKIGLLGTKFTMEQDFYKGRLIEKYGIDVIVPQEADQMTIHSIIYNELIQGIVKPESKNEYIQIIQKLIESGAEGVVLGCTEIPMLIKQEDIKVPIFDTTAIHAKFAVDTVRYKGTTIPSAVSG